MGRVIGRIFRRITRAIVMRPVVGLSIFVVLLLGGAGLGYLVLSSGTMNPLGTANRSTESGAPMSAGVTHQAPSSTENYLKGNQSFNAELMWSALGAESQERFRSRGATTQELQQQMDAARDQGTKLDDFSYIGGQQLPDGTSMHFYLVLTRGPQSRNDPTYIPYIFTLDRGGKIARVQ
ncbi:MAG: hypothetical protein ACKVVP_01735 [Chloroflexota bacterium]